MMAGNGNHRARRRSAAGQLARLCVLALVSCGMQSSDLERPEFDVVVQQVAGQIVPSTPIGTLPGQLTVGDDGNANYVLPLWVPPGRAGMQPNLALAYSSSAGNDLLGVGWTLSGVSSVITRCGSTLARDGEYRPVQYSGFDHLCMDGARLVVSNGRAYYDTAAEYRTEPNSFSKIVPVYSAGIVAGFTVYTKDGLIKRYAYGPGGAGPWGAQTDAWLQVSNRNQTDTVRIGFLLNRIEDRDGNAITITYEHPTGSYWQQRTRPKRIDYTFGVSSLPANRSITFEYQSRTDIPRAWTQGTEHVTDFRLTRINANVGGSLVRRYDFAYEYSPSSGRSRLTRVQACDHPAGDPAAVCLPYTEFNYSDSSHEFVLSGLLFLGGSASAFDRPSLKHGGLQTGDFNGDGRDDILFYGTNGRWNVHLALPPSYPPGFFGPTIVQDRVPGSFPPYAYPTAQVIDINNDGAADLASMPCFFYSGCHLKLYLSDGTPDNTSSVHFGEPTAPFYSEYYDLPYDDSGAGSERQGFVDLDGDGFLDYFDGWSSIYYWTGTSPNRWLGDGLLNQSPYITLGRDPDPSKTLFQDIDGDGHVDFFVPYQSGSSLRFDAIHLRSRAGTREVTTATTNLTYDPCDVHADANGDGLLDVIRIRDGSIFFNAGLTGPPAGPRRAYFVWFVGRFPVNMTGWCETPDFDYGTRVVDYNGDGKDDILFLGKTAPTAEYMRVLVSRPSGDGYDLIGGSSTFPPLHPDDYETYGSIGNRIIDADGDGLYDIAMLDSSNFLYTYRQTGVPPDLLVEAINGLGATQKVVYASLTAAGVYTPGSNCPLPANGTVRCTKDSKWVVKTEYVDTGSALTGFLAHSYGEGLTDAQQGFLGFGWHKVVDSRTGSTTVTRYGRLAEAVTIGGATRYPYVGVPTERLSYVVDGRAHAVRGQMTYDTRTLTDATYFVVPVSTTTVRYEGTSFNPAQPDATPALQTITTTYGTPDAFGNIPSVVTVAGDFTSAKTITQFHNDADNWVIGRPKDLTISSNGPGPGNSASYSMHVDYDSVGHPLQIVREPGASAAGDGLYNRTKLVWGIYGLPTAVYVTPDSTDCSGIPCGLKVRSATLVYPGTDPDRMFPSTISNAFGQTSSFTWHAGFGVPLAITAIDGVQSGTNYDGFGRFQKSLGADGSWTTLAFASNELSPFVEVWDGSDGSHFERTYNRIGQMVRTATRMFDGSLSIVDSAYDSLGRITSVSRPHWLTANPVYEQRFGYDKLGRITSSQRAVRGGAVLATSTASYVDLTSDLVDEDGVRSTIQYDNAGHVASTSVYPNGAEARTTFGYGPFDALTRVTDAAGNVVTMAYDKLGRPTRIDDLDIGFVRWTYTGFDEVFQETVPPGYAESADSVTTHEYDNLGRLTKATSNDGVDIYVYNNSTAAAGSTGRLTSQRRETNATAYSQEPALITESFGYDALGRMTSATKAIDGDSFAFSYQYDAQSRLLRTWYPSTGPGALLFQIQNVYNANGYLSELRVVNGSCSSDAQCGGGGYVCSFGGGGTAASCGGGECGACWYPGNPAGEPRQPYIAWEVDAEGHFTTEQFTNKVIKHTYDLATGRLQRIFTPDSPQVIDETYDYYPGGNLRTKTDAIANVSETYVYDSADRLWKATLTVAGVTKPTAIYEYDSIGNLTRSTDNNCTFTYGGGVKLDGTPTGPHQAVTASCQGYPLTYDGRGNVVVPTGYFAIIHTTFNKPRYMYDFADHNEWIAYDANHVRTRKSSPSPLRADNPWNEVLYVGPFERRTRDTDQDYVHYVSANGKLVGQWSPNSGWQTTYSDRLGSTSAITDDQSIVEDRLGYDPWGGRREPDGTAGIPPDGVKVGYTGHSHDDEWNLIDMGGRIYHPGLKRFLEADPIVSDPAFGPSWNRYSYVSNNPTRYTDPSGYQMSWGCVSWPSGADNPYMQPTIGACPGLQMFFLEGNNRGGDSEGREDDDGRGGGGGRGGSGDPEDPGDKPQPTPQPSGVGTFPIGSGGLRGVISGLVHNGVPARWMSAARGVGYSGFGEVRTSEGDIAWRRANQPQVGVPRPGSPTTEQIREDALRQHAECMGDSAGMYVLEAGCNKALQDRLLIRPSQNKWTGEDSVHLLATAVFMLTPIRGAGATRVYAGGGGPGPGITLSQAEAAASRHGIDTRLFQLQREVGTPGYYGFISFDGANNVVRAANGRFVLTLTDSGLVSVRTAVETISHELNHIRAWLKTRVVSSEAAAEAAARAASPFIR